MNKIKKLIYSSAVVLMCASCGEGYLDTKPTDKAGPVTIFETTANVKTALNGICKLMTTQYIHSQGFNGEGTIKMYYGNYPGNDFYVYLTGWASLINGTFHDNNSSTYDYYPWFYYYMLIGNANAIIANVDAAKGTDGDKAFIKAQALTFRAYSFMMLSQLYCYRWDDSENGTSDGLVLRLDESLGDFPLSNLKQTYEQMYTDLDQAITLYSGTKNTRDNNFSPDINVAYAVYARAALNRQDYAKAAEYAAKARKGYPLMSVRDYKAGFCNPTSEWIWSSYGASDESLFFYSFFSYMAYNSSAGAVRNTPKCITNDLFNQIPKTDIRRDLFLDPTGYDYTKSSGRASKKLAAHARDLYPDLNPRSTPFAYMQFKIKANDMPGVGHLNHFRSSEMVLIEAEANYFLVKEAEAQNALVELNKSTGRNPEYVCDKTGMDLLKEIKLYRSLELWGEGFDWFDMKRWNDPIVRRSTDDGGVYPAALAKTILPKEGNKWTWKIPLKETDFNKGLDLLPEAE
ncbi:MAG: RagB/SusD family nutrient uptake outer membrane protein [Bacteroides sp.]